MKHKIILEKGSRYYVEISIARNEEKDKAYRLKIRNEALENFKAKLDFDIPVKEEVIKRVKI